MEVIDVLHKIGYVSLQDFGKDWRTTPLYRASDNKTSLCINKSNGQWYDFSARDGGSLLGLVKLTMSLPTMKAAQAFIGDTSFIIEPPTKHRYELLETKKFDKNLLFKLQKDHSYWVERGISELTVSTFQGGTTFNGRMCYRYVFPVFNSKDELVGFSGRRLNDNSDYPKWKHIGPKSTWCYPLKWNQDFLYDSKEAILVESIGDMLALWDAGIKNVIVTFGVDISVKIVELLLRMDAQRILIAFNNDEENNLVGNQAAVDGKKFLLNHFDSSQVVVAIPTQKDFGEMDNEQITLWKNKFLS
jgi:hypothetical protein